MAPTETAADCRVPLRVDRRDEVAGTEAPVTEVAPEYLIAGPVPGSWQVGALLRRRLSRSQLAALVISVVVLTAGSALAHRPWLRSTQQPPGSTTTATWSATPPRLSPNGHLEGNSGVPTFLDGAVWLPVGSDLIRFNADMKLMPVGAELVRIQPDTGIVTGRVPLRSTGSFTFALGSSIVVATSSGAEVINSSSLRHERTLPGGQALAYGSIWDVRDGALMRIDIESGQVTGRLAVQDESGPYKELHMATAEGSVWVGAGSTASVLRIDPHTMRTIATVELDAVPGRVVVGSGYGHIWATQSLHGSGVLFKIDPDTNRITSTVHVGDPLVGNAPGNGGRTIGFGNGSVWTCDSSGTLTRVDPVTTDIQSIRKLAFDTCTWLGVGAGSVWASTDALDENPSTVRIDP